MERTDVGKLSRRDRGFAMSCWREQGGQPPREPRDFLFSYQLELPHGQPKPQYFIQAAQLIVRTRHEGRKTGLLNWKGKQALVWQGDDFFVPPGLWGAGIGEDFLRLITSSPDMARHASHHVRVERGSLLAVRLLVNQDASAARRKRWADDVQLYRSLGFSEPDQDLRDWLSTVDEEFKIHPALDWTPKRTETWKRYWLTRTFDPREDTTARPGGSSGGEATHRPEDSGYEESTVH
jgi:hypothetical protein